jgi:hypothetical protein
VERLLGAGGNAPTCSYRLDGVNVIMNYSSGSCETGEAWSVPNDTVLLIRIYPKPRTHLADLRMDLSRFEKRPDIAQASLYVNEEDGITLVASGDEVTGVYYGPAASDRKLRCPTRAEDIFPPDVPEELRPRLLERLNQFVEYSRTKQFEKLYGLYLPEVAVRFFPARDARGFAEWARSLGELREWIENWVDFKPGGLIGFDSEAYGKAWRISGLATTLESGKVVQSYRNTQVVLKGGEWYFVDLFRLAPL